VNICSSGRAVADAGAFKGGGIDVVIVVFRIVISRVKVVVLKSLSVSLKRPPTG